MVDLLLVHLLKLLEFFHNCLIRLEEQVQLHLQRMQLLTIRLLAL